MIKIENPDPGKRPLVDGPTAASMIAHGVALVTVSANGQPVQIRMVEKGRQGK